MKPRVLCLAIVFSCILFATAQKAGPSKSGANAPAKTDVDPLALQILKAATDPIRDAKSYTFRALVSREHLGTNGQVITLFNMSNVTVQRPDKLHMDFRGRGKDIEIYYDAGNATLSTPSEKLYSSFTAPKTIDEALVDLHKRDIFIPIQNFLNSDPYQSLTKELSSGYLVGQVMLFDQPVDHLAFTEPNAEWQLWIVGGEKQPRIRRLEVVDTTKAYRPRVTVDFLDWDLNATPGPEAFKFNKPPDAKEIPIHQESARKQP